MVTGGSRGKQNQTGEDSRNSTCTGNIREDASSLNSQSFNNQSHELKVSYVYLY